MKIFCLLALIVLGSAASAADTASPDDVKLVRIFLKTPVAELPPEAIDHFLSVEPESLPEKLRKPFEAKRIELYTLKHLADGKKEGPIRTPAADCAAPQGMSSQQIGVLHQAGYIDLDEDQEQCIEHKSQCSERQLMCEFTLQVVVTPRDKKKGTRHLLMYVKDPALAYLAICNPHASVGGQTNFFGAMNPVCGR